MATITWNTGNKIGDKGGFGEVYETVKSVDGKVQPGKYARKNLIRGDDDSIARFKREVRLLKSLSHPRIVKVEGYRLSDEPYFYTMPLYKYSFRKILPTITNDYYKIKTIFNEIFQGVEYLHEQGVYHRDLKPENILMNSDTDLVISDLGLCIDINSESTRITQTGQGFGSLLYVAPEQWINGKEVNECADIFSLGRMIYESFVGELKEITTDTGKLPNIMRYCIDKCIKPNPDDRFQTVNDLREVFNSSVDLLINGSNNSDISSIIDDINSSDSISKKQIRELDNAFANVNLEDEKDFLFDIMMKIRPVAISKLYDIDPHIAKSVIIAFSEHASNHGWSFSYTDDIGDKCREYYNVISDPQVRAKLLYSILEVGVSHNRWYVMGIFSDLFEEIDDPEEAYLVVEVLEPIKYKLNSIDINKSKINKILLKLFNKRKEESED